MSVTRQPPRRKGLNAEKVAAALTLADGSPTGAARMLGVTRNTINYWRERIAQQNAQDGNEAA